jgi:hypothetical protein
VRPFGSVPVTIDGASGSGVGLFWASAVPAAATASETTARQASAMPRTRWRTG